MEATKEQIMTTAAILLAGAMSGDTYATHTESRLKYTGVNEVKDAVRIAKLIAENIGEK
jgi:hypothetical protein